MLMAFFCAVVITRLLSLYPTVVSIYTGMPEECFGYVGGSHPLAHKAISRAGYATHYLGQYMPVTKIYHLNTTLFLLKTHCKHD